ncbi:MULTISPECIES: type IV toxin-antitoxin system AbiEi family antitoxin domain-containing protein [unclassified Isoptericola]|uniref:type IV toxin-antitoxin system AbiEi family antitoxin domain-containing protein n=1 Tax=unclassified Isoptericola TaxID=2623355 RepID=UPI002712448E|nr:MULTISPECIES: type IV toxin-antitoxin system AbiEi family antitoxin domain-containing protein [unclassified Isoptericola]MDO8145805.1 type IV toxin-antitoxin system AbiEi family antitoxin domain-containing protein [Isoptericola sp. 178]MDO8149886.1 type IV toxin-antitoxin system AbiEi family antitoxin domain-containing protein [Isoptericola sp. b408]
MPSPPLVVPQRARRIAARQEGLLSTDQCRSSGITRQQAARLVAQGRWRRPVRGVYDTGVPGEPGRDRLDRARRRAALLGPLACPGTVATGVAALVLHGVQGAPVEVRSEVTVPDGSARRGPGPVRVRRLRLRRWAEVDGIACALPEDALAHAVPTLPRYRAVAMMDSAGHRGLVSRALLDRAREKSGDLAGSAARRPWWDECDPRAESPAETWARLSCADAGVAPDALQLRLVGESGRVVARVDLAWLLPDGSALLVEIDGRDAHTGPEALVADRIRQNRIVGRRSLVRRYTGREAWNGTVAREVARLLAAEGWHPHRVPTDHRFVLPR